MANSRTPPAAPAGRWRPAPGTPPRAGFPPPPGEWRENPPPGRARPCRGRRTGCAAAAAGPGWPAYSCPGGGCRSGRKRPP